MLKGYFTRRVFFAYDYHNDMWRARRIHDVSAIPEAHASGFFSPSEVKNALAEGKEGVQQMVLKHLEGTSVTVVLIGADTSDHLWVKYEIEQSIARKNGFLGIRIHDLTNKNGLSTSPGRIPRVPQSVEFPEYTWDGNLARFTKEIEAAGKRSDALRV